MKMKMRMGKLVVIVSVPVLELLPLLSVVLMVFAVVWVVDGRGNLEEGIELGLALEKK